MSKITEEEIKKILPEKGPSFEEVEKYLNKYSKEYKQHVDRIFELFNYDPNFPVLTRDINFTTINKAIKQLLRNC